MSVLTAEQIAELIRERDDRRLWADGGRSTSDCLDTITDLQQRLAASERLRAEASEQRIAREQWISEEHQRQLAELRELGPCGVHPKALREQINPTDEAEYGSPPVYRCTACARENQRIAQARLEATILAFDQAVAAIDECHRRNISGENWHERTHNFVRAEGDRRISELEKAAKGEGV